MWEDIARSDYSLDSLLDNTVNRIFKEGGLFDDMMNYMKTAQ